MIVWQLIAGTTERYKVDGITNPQQMVWVNPYTVVFAVDGNITKVNVFTKSTEYIGNIEPNVFVGVSNNKELQYCTIKHYLITSRDQFSTIFEIDGKELRFFETIRPIHWQGNIMIAQTALDFLEQHYYEIDTDNGDMKEIPHPPMLRNKAAYIEEDIPGDIYVNYNAREYFKFFFLHFD